MPNQTHTKTPWILTGPCPDTPDTSHWFAQANANSDDRKVDVCECFPIDDDGQVGRECHANAAFIVRACNSHDALVESLEKCEAVANDLFEDLKAYGDQSRRQQFTAICNNARAAIAIANAKGQ